MNLNKKDGLLYDIQQYILENSWVPQPELSAGAALTILSTVIDRKYVYQDNCANIYSLSIAKSGSGKNAPQKAIKDVLLELGLGSARLGAGSYVSTASLMDSLTTKPVRVDVIDEASEFLAVSTKGGASYQVGMSDVLCELYTSSNDYYPGRMLASKDGETANIRGNCIRPFVNVFMSTTPRGFKEGLNISSLEKGLMGRCLLFFGKHEIGAPAKGSTLSAHLKNELSFIATRNPKVEMDKDYVVTKRFDQSEHSYFVAETCESAKEYNNELFLKYRHETMDCAEDDPMAAILARAYQMICKISLIHSLSQRPTSKEIIITKENLKFGDKIVQANIKNFIHSINSDLTGTREEEAYRKVKSFIEKKGFVTKQNIRNSLRGVLRKEREIVLTELLEYGIITYGQKPDKDGNILTGYMYIGSTNG